ncbi:MAG: SAM-dependent methyltransferase [Burkholderiales bacterium]|jgi:16S rRNA (cytidine1402-2'-O)-methyltransferase|nr:SAM-dependent methyltransferase [Burkholderiales bacterium]
MSSLYLVPNLLGVMSPHRVLPEHTLKVARELSYWIVENAKPARAFLGSLNLSRPIASLTIAELPEKPNAASLDALLHPCLHGENVGLLSDAGCPAVADPGAVLVARAHQLNIRVCPLVGPSSLLLALMASGMNGQTFSFHGYLPIAANDRAETLKRLERQSRARQHETCLFIETPYRNQALLKTALATLSPQTVLCVAADLTTERETVIRQTIRQWQHSELPNLDKRPAIFLLSA